ncbi:hypothetical protein [uncultured Clostridium sp.]|uniref:hypothetical protein n=1 Tax=uncultured Clostridium sp. TaxID=59620 RepID=UPI0028ECFA5B|nr:hypothetical protein [uncultured Clostridium sp.]
MREVKFRYDLLNRHEIKIGQLDYATEGRITFNSQAEIKRTCSLDFRENESKEIDFLNDRIKPYFMLKMPNGDWLEYPLGIFLISTPKKIKKGNYFYRDAEGYDSTMTLKEDKFTTRYIIYKGQNYVKAIIDIINTAGIWKINIPSSELTTEMDKEFEIGTSKLEAINSLLKEVNYTSIWVDNNGALTSATYQVPTIRKAEYVYRNDDLSVILSDNSSEELDLFNVPNVWVITASNPEKEPLVSRYTNDAKDSITSTVNRSRNIVHFESVNDIADQNTLDDYVRRVAYNTSDIYSEFNFQTALMPHHSFMDCLFIHHDKFGITSKYVETNWEMDLKLGGTMSHTCRKVIQI